jgi:hypothetical protein
MIRLLAFISLIILVSCSDKANQAAIESQMKGGSVADSITEVKILYYPSFTNSATLSLNRITDTGVFIVDTMVKFSYGEADTIRFSIRDMESKTDLNKFWTSSFIYSLRQDSSMRGWFDGMPCKVHFKNKGKSDSVYLGNVYPKRVKIILTEQINYLAGRSTNKATKIYLESIRRYL